MKQEPTKNALQAISDAVATAVATKQPQRVVCAEEGVTVTITRQVRKHIPVAMRPEEIRRRALFEIRLRGSKGSTARRMNRANRGIPAESFTAELERMEAEGLVKRFAGEQGATAWALVDGGAK